MRIISSAIQEPERHHRPEEQDAARVGAGWVSFIERAAGALD
jgi:hypothetical protein